ncbi:hypothetical protein [Pseudonocardia zijingensis]|uniref:PPE family protein n=1 Tax=Pseudonocardia zijingensis TaxID=153376 RepID=A0ABN1NXC7_9PSEU
MTAQPLDWEGAGVASSWADLGAALSAEHVDPFQVAFTAAGAGLDTLGFVADPLDSLLTAGLGWLVEHVWFLREPLDALAGDPAQITAEARTWHHVGVELGAVAQQHRAAAEALGAWEGVAADGYRVAADLFGGALEQAGRDAARLAELILGSGAQVGTVRALVRDGIVGWVVEAVETAVLAGVAALVTAGGALGVGAVRLITSAVSLAHQLSRLVGRLLDAMILAGGTAAQISGAIRQSAAVVGAARPVVRDAERAAEHIGAARFVEYGKQHATAAQGERGWGQAPS